MNQVKWWIRNCRKSPIQFFLKRSIIWTTRSRHNTSRLTGPNILLLILHNRPMVHTRDREPVTQMIKWKTLATETLGSNPTGVHSLVWLPKAYWLDLMKVEPAVQVKAGLVWSFLIELCLPNCLNRRGSLLPQQKKVGDINTPTPSQFSWRG